MLRSVLLKSLWEIRRALLWWSVGLVALASMMVAIFPSIHRNRSLVNLVQDYPRALKAFIAFGGSVDYTSPAGFLGSELFALTVPLALVVAAIGAGARALAGEEEQRTLDILLANPISRSRLVLEKLGALVAELALLSIALWLALAVGTRLASMPIGLGNLAAATLQAGLLALLYGALALLVGAATGTRGTAIAVPAGAAFAAYLANALGAIVDGLRPARIVSPFYHYVAGDALRHGLAVGHAAVLLAIGLAFVALAHVVFARRDLA